jgi:hypothetical protein
MRTLPVIMAGVLVCTAAMAHHGAPGYDFSKALTLEGDVIEVQWKNPHVYFTIENAGVDGKPRRLDIEAASVSTVLAFGLRREMLVPGTHVKVLGFGRLRDPDGANYKGATVTLPNGSTYYIENTPQGVKPVREAIAATALSGKWLPASSASFGEYMQAEFKAHGAVQGGNAEAGAKPQDATNAVGLANFSCANLAKNVSVPFATSALYVLRTVEVRDKNVVMSIDADGFVVKRDIHLPPAEHPASVAPTQLGHSIGHWEGQTLVIDTVAFSPGRGQSASKHMTERLGLTEDRHQLRYEVTVEDPDNYPTPFHYEMLWNHRPDLAMSGVACDDQIARKFLSLK